MSKEIQRMEARNELIRQHMAQGDKEGAEKLMNIQSAELMLLGDKPESASVAAELAGLIQACKRI